MRWAGHVARVGEGRGVYRVLVGRPEGKRPLGRTRRRWQDNIKMDLREVGCRGMNWIQLTQDSNRWRTLVNAVMNLRVPQNAGNFLTSCKPVSFSRRTLLHAVSIILLYRTDRQTDMCLNIFVKLRFRSSKHNHNCTNFLLRFLYHRPEDDTLRPKRVATSKT
jgi:hypothetical protein